MSYRFTEYFETKVLAERPYLTKEVCLAAILPDAAVTGGPPLTTLALSGNPEGIKDLDVWTVSRAGQGALPGRRGKALDLSPDEVVEVH